jgi:hypothetical protein
MAMRPLHPGREQSEMITKTLWLCVDSSHSQFECGGEILAFRGI